MEKKMKTILTALFKVTVIIAMLFCGSDIIAQNGNTNASKVNGGKEYNLGKDYLYGHNGKPCNFDSAIYWFAKSAEMSDKYCGVIAQMLFRRCGQCMEKVLPYVFRAASNGDLTSNQMLAYFKSLPKSFKNEEDKVLYLKSCYIGVDNIEHQIWNEKEIKKLISMGHPIALYKRAKTNSGAGKNSKQVFKDYFLASQCDFPNALTGLAGCYLSGKGTKTNTELGMQTLRAAAEMGEIEAISFLGSIYYNGWYNQPVDKDLSYKFYSKIIYDKQGNLIKNPGYGASYCMYSVAKNFFSTDKAMQIKLMTAAEKKCTKAHDWLVQNTDIYTTPAQWYQRGLAYYNKKQYDAAIDPFRHAAVKGHSWAIFYLGNSFYMSVNQSYDSAFYWYSKAYEHLSDYGNQAWYMHWNMSNMYQIGIGGHRNLKEARRLFQESRKIAPAEKRGELDYLISSLSKEINGAVNVYNEGVKLYEMGDLEGAFQKYKEAAECGDKMAQNNLGVCYSKGEGVEKNKAEAIYWYRQSAEQGEVLAMLNLGICLLDSNPSEAVSWLEKSAAKGNTSAMTELGRCYEEGNGVQKNPERALEYYRKGAAADNGEAIYWLGHCYDEGIGVGKNKAQAISLYTKASEKGCSRADFSLAMAYYYGSGVAVDKEKGIMYMRKASNAKDSSFRASYAAGILQSWLKEGQGEK